ncbi:MAG: hypothetical protein ABIG37_03205 [Nanoarchaeota archaeon]|nr:hypothetical protein [Nanoarchaeota archaeon]
MYLKRNKIPKTWPLKRKGTKYLVRTSHDLKNSIPLMIVLRDILKLTTTKKETKKILNLQKVKINNKLIKNEKFPLSIFDNLKLENKNYKVIIKNKKLNLIEIPEKESQTKISKVIGKKILKQNKIQVNLHDGRNYIIKEKISTGDSVIIDLKENKISKILPLKEKSKVLFTSGKHIGRQAKIEKIEHKNIILEFEGEKINGKLKNLIVIE